MTEPEPHPPITHANRGDAHSAAGTVLRSSLGTPTAWLAAAVPIGIGTVIAAVVGLLPQILSSSVVNGHLVTVGGEDPLWWLIARLIGGVALGAGIVVGLASAARVVRDAVDRRRPSVRRAWRAALGSAGLLAAVTMIAVVATGAAASGIFLTFPVAGVFVPIVVLVGCVLLAPLTLVLPVDALEDAGLDSFGRSFAVARAFSQRNRGSARARTAFILLFGLALGGAIVVVVNTWGGSLLLVAAVTAAAALVALAWTVLAAGVWTGVAADGLEALGRAPVEGRTVAAPAPVRRLLLAIGALIVAPALTASVLTLDVAGIPEVTSQEARPASRAPALAPYGDAGVAFLDTIEGHIVDLVLCEPDRCRTLELPVLLSMAMSATPEGDLVFARWRRAPDAPQLVLTRLTAAELRTLSDDDDIDRRVDSRRLGEDDGPGTTVVIETFDEEITRPRVLDERSQNTTAVAVDATGATPVIASLEAFPTAPDGEQRVAAPELSVYRCADAGCSSSSVQGEATFEWMPAVDGSAPTVLDVAADDRSAAVGLASYAKEADPIRLFTFVEGQDPVVSSFSAPYAGNEELVGDDTAGINVELRPDGLATMLWRLPRESTLNLESCADVGCTDWHTEEIDLGIPQRRSGPSVALAIDETGLPLVAVATPEHTLALLDCLDAECRDSERIDLVDIVWDGAPIVLTLDAVGRPIVLAGGAFPTPTIPVLRSRLVGCLDVRCG